MVQHVPINDQDEPSTSKIDQNDKGNNDHVNNGNIFEDNACHHEDHSSKDNEDETPIQHQAQIQYQRVH